MRRFGKVGLALAAATLAGAASAAIDSRPAPPPQPRLDTPVEPDGRLAPPPGGWTRDGWSDEARAPRGAGPRPDGPPAEDRRAVEPRADGPRLDGPRMARDDGGPRGEWRRRTWDGGRGEAFRYRRGVRLPRTFISPRYVVADWGGYGLAPPGPGRNWVRYYGDAVLVDGYGVVIDAVPGIGWGDGRGPDFAYDRGGYDYRGPDRRWHDDSMAWGHGGGWGGHPPYGHHAPGGVTVIVTTTPGVATTTTTTTEEYVYSSPRKTWKARPRTKVLRYTK